MNNREFAMILPLLQMYKDCCRADEATDAWYQSLKDYAFTDIDGAVREYVRTCSYTPVPADIIRLLPKADPKVEFRPMYDSQGRQLIQCRRCNDLGLIMWEDSEGRRRGKPCDCPAGHAKYSWGWKSRGEQEEYVKKHGSHGERIGESWYE